MTKGEPPPDRKLDWTALIETALTVEGSMGDTYSRFHDYSLMNKVNLLMQGCPLEPIATYKKWLALGRQVQRGAKAYEIIRPIVIPKRDAAGEKTDEAFLRFKPVRCIFPVSMTEGDELPPVDVPAWNLETALAALDIERVRFRTFDANTAGYSRDRTYAINPVAKYPAKTTMHELSHIVAGHTVRDQHAEYVAHRGIREFEAEGSAHLVMTELELLTAEEAQVSRAYLQHWIAGEAPPEPSIRKVFTTTDTILRAGRVAVVEAASVSDRG
jgi:hypothetical protein